jgi:hypothetical protein
MPICINPNNPNDWEFAIAACPVGWVTQEQYEKDTEQRASQEPEPLELLGFDTETGEPLWLDPNTQRVLIRQPTPAGGGTGGQPGFVLAPAPPGILQRNFGEEPKAGSGAAGSFSSITDANGNVIFFNPTTGQRVDPGVNVGGAEPPWFVQRRLGQEDEASARAFAANESAVARAFQGYQADLDRAQAAQFRAQEFELARRNTALAEAQFMFQIQQVQAEREAQAIRDRVSAARELSNVVSMADPLAQQVFGSNIQGALAGGATGLTKNAIEPAAQILTTLSGDPIEAARQRILELRQGVELPTLFNNAASPDDLGLQNVGLQNAAPDSITGFVNALQARSGVSASTYGSEANRRRLSGVNRRSLALSG